MKKKKIILNYKGKKLSLDLFVLPRSLYWLGLMFSRRSKAKNLLFSFDKETKMSIHSFFVFHSFLAIWLDSRGKIVDVKIVKPFNLGISPREKYKSLIEIPLSKGSDEVLKFLDAGETFK
jgi:uncharacterized membrane protein (UPF0127 family)